MPRSKGRRLPATALRPFFITFVCISAIAAYSCFVDYYHIRQTSASGRQDRLSSLTLGNHASPLLTLAPKSAPLPFIDDPVACIRVHEIPLADQCAFVRANCEDENAGLLPYLRLYYCNLVYAKPLAFIILVAWLGLLFSTIGIAASDFFSINLSTIATILGLSESLAGVTFLAFGNGSPDLFSTFAAMNSNSATMAVGELVGAACFITAVVAGSMALVREFKVDRNTFVRDICFFAGAVTFTVAFLTDGNLHLWECCVMIGYYIIYVVTVVTWHWYSSRRSRRLPIPGAVADPPRETSPLIHPRTVSASSSTDIVPELPARVDSSTHFSPTPNTRTETGFTAISFLDIGPRIEIDECQNDQDLDNEQERLVAAQVASNMRVLRPRGRRRSTIAPLRPSLVGALEFRSALAQAQREAKLYLESPTPSRSLSETNLMQSANNYGATDATSKLNVPGAGVDGLVPTRDRALSSSEVEGSSSIQPVVSIDERLAHVASGTASIHSTSPSRTRSPSPSFTVGGSLAPPPASHPTATAAAGRFGHSPPLPGRLAIPIDSRDSSTNVSPTLSPFPTYNDPQSLNPAAANSTENDMLLPNRSRSGSGYFPLFKAPDWQDSFGSAQTQEVAPALAMPSWCPKWAAGLFPSRDLLLRTLFPTLQDWKDKSIWDKFISMASMPSLLLLVITLPVVETERDEDSNIETTIVDPVGLGTSAVLADVIPGHPLSPRAEDHEWQIYRRFHRSNTGKSSAGSPALISINSPNRARSRSTVVTPLALPPSSHPPSPTKSSNMALALPAGGMSPFQSPVPQRSHNIRSNGIANNNFSVSPMCDINNNAAADADEDDEDEDDNKWNRWLVALQIFAGPQFAAMILWANLREDMDNPSDTLFWMTLGMFAISCVLFVMLLSLTSDTQRPRYHYLLCFLGFLISIAWISTIAGEVVGVLKAFGVILKASEAILGLTVFAAGNSVGDLVADITVARLGHPVMALSACFGGPMLNILLGIGLGGVWMMTQAANRKHSKHPDRPYRYKPYHIHVGGTLMVSAITLLVTLLILLIVVPMHKWMLTRRLGWGLIILWSVSTVANVVIELTGFFADYD